MASFRWAELLLAVLCTPNLVLAQNLTVAPVAPFTPAAVLNEIFTIDPALVHNVTGTIVGDPSSFGMFTADPGLLGLTEVSSFPMYK